VIGTALPPAIAQVGFRVGCGATGPRLGGGRAEGFGDGSYEREFRFPLPVLELRQVRAGLANPLRQFVQRESGLLPQMPYPLAEQEGVDSLGHHNFTLLVRKREETYFFPPYNESFKKLL
jgi:hypothetical protein